MGDGVVEGGAEGEKMAGAMAGGADFWGAEDCGPDWGAADGRPRGVKV